MRILVPLPFDPSDTAHGRNLRVVNLLTHMSPRAEIRCLVESAEVAGRLGRMLPGARVEPAEAVLSPCDRRVPRVSRIGAYFGSSAGLTAAAAACAGRADAVLGFDLPSINAVLAAGSAASRPRLILDVIDDPWLTWLSGRRAERLGPSGLKTALCVRLARRFLLPRLDALVAVSPRDAASLSRACGKRVRVVPNGVALQPPDCLTQPREPMVIFTGAMDFGPNERAACRLARQLWPEIRRTAAERDGGGAGSLELVIAGSNPTAAVRALAELPGVRVTGWVADLGLWLRRACVAVAPMDSGTGMKNKVLEALAAACPVVATSAGAAGLPVGEAHGLVVEDAPDRLARAAGLLAADPVRARRLGRAGWRTVRDRYAWADCAGLMIETVGELVRRCRTAPAAATGLRTGEQEALPHAAS